MKEWFAPLAVVSSGMILLVSFVIFERSQSLLCFAGSDYYKIAFTAMGLSTFFAAGLCAGWLIYATRKSSLLRIIIPLPIVLLSLVAAYFVLSIQFDVWLPDVECPFSFVQRFGLPPEKWSSLK